MLEEEKHKLAQSSTAELGDDLDAYMSGLSSQLGMLQLVQLIFTSLRILTFLMFITNLISESLKDVTFYVKKNIGSGIHATKNFN